MQKELLILSYSNLKNRSSQNYETSLRYWKYDYKVVGNGETWKNYMTKISSYRDNVKRYQKRYKYVCITDCFDVIACGPPRELIDKYLSFNKDIVFSSENNCLSGKCIYLKSWWDKQKIKEPDFKYLNSGFFIGKIDSILEALNFAMDLYKDYNITDDQLALCMYAEKKSDKIALDINRKMVGTIAFDFFDYDYIKDKNRIYNTKTKTFPCFIHTPGNSSDFSYRLDYYGEKMYKNYIPENFNNGVHSFFKYLKSNRELKLILILVIIFIFSVFMYRKKIIYILLISTLILLLIR